MEEEEEAKTDCFLKEKVRGTKGANRSLKVLTLVIRVL
jgi:hypothetical protein